jgi:hypothetical protein
LRLQLETRYPTLWLIEDDQTITVEGTFPVLHPATQDEIGHFQIEITLLSDFPSSMPLLRETGGRIPWIAARHCYQNGMACLFVPEERLSIWPQKAGLVELLDGPIAHYFFGQVYFESAGSWPFGERKHGLLGRLEYYQELLGPTEDPRAVVGFIQQLTKNQVRGHHKCFCGSGKSMRSCHFQTVLKARTQVSPLVATDFLTSLCKETLRRKTDAHQLRDRSIGPRQCHKGI